MSTETTTTTDASDLSDRELLERLAAQDHALAPVAENALQEDDS